MKNFILGVSCFMMIALIVALVFYEKQTDSTKQGFDPTMEEQLLQNIPQTPQIEKLRPINNERISYTLQKEQLNITFNQGKDWQTVPIDKELLFNGEYIGNEQQLIDGSYILTETRVAFLYSDGSNWENQTIHLLYSLDQGKTWENATVSEQYPTIRFRKVDFVTDTFGYVIISGDRTMSSELSDVFLTFDGGKSWKETTNSGVTRLIYDGGFINESIGFLSYGTINPEAPDLYVTEDGGNSWHSAVVNIPENYDRIFVSAEVPTIEGDHLAMLVNQGPNGDYLGGKVKGKFLSTDNGKTWEFSMEVNPDETEAE
ncbi:oxidoreductase [Caldibacillus lycopersici]|uniref:Oxidoreductase n=1 Tax=Perspicuibacillus lycopersici TaxID=1325689 RepID=A0AAE3LR96_9BACI|nr:oxidoreductase [Perspicuibacillus lycopersici]MCU9614379.1 oxidoreductase [Perspicuibacillus lycopersici]